MTASPCLESSFDAPVVGARSFGGVDFVDAVSARDAVGAPDRARVARSHPPTPVPWLEVTLAPPPWRGSKLREAIDSAIEQVLDCAGAPPAGVNSLGDLDASLSDQLFRARTLGANGLVLYVPDLTLATGPAGALDAEDSAVLRWWIDATSERPVRLVLDAANRVIGAYGPPTRLELLVGPRVDVPAFSARTSRDGHTHADAALERAEGPDGRGDRSSDENAVREQHAPQVVPEREPEEHRASSFASAGERRSIDGAMTEPRIAPSPPAADRLGGTAGADHPREHPPAEAHRAVRETREEPPAPRFGRLMLPRQGGPNHARVDVQPRSDAATTLDPEHHSRVVPVFPRRDPPPTAPIPGAGPPPASIDWRAFATDLELARGPKPLAIVERLFMSRYVALLECVARGETDESAQRTVEQWADDFARSYTEGFSALKVTGKRPRMVLDAPQLCNQIARLHGAKSTQLILVDGMRFDVGLRVQERLAQALVTRATCTERLLLWSALPTTTPAQLDLLARGPEGLTSPGPPSDGEELGVRGRTSATLRRVRIGARDLLKLDAVESRLRESGPPLGERLDAMADEVASAIAAHARTQPPRTLMFIFGDHGFRMQSDDVGTCAATSGGASPEEVLVPAFAWLVGDVH